MVDRVPVAAGSSPPPTRADHRRPLPCESASVPSPEDEMLALLWIVKNSRSTGPLRPSQFVDRGEIRIIFNRIVFHVAEIAHY